LQLPTHTFSLRENFGVRGRDYLMVWAGLFVNLAQFNEQSLFWCPKEAKFLFLLLFFLAFMPQDAILRQRGLVLMQRQRGGEKYHSFGFTFLF
jgi:hypothetical protein